MAKEIFKGFEKNLIDKTIFNRSRVQFAKKRISCQASRTAD